LNTHSPRHSARIMSLTNFENIPLFCTCTVTSVSCKVFPHPCLPSPLGHSTSSEMWSFDQRLPPTWPRSRMHDMTLCSQRMLGNVNIFAGPSLVDKNGCPTIFSANFCFSLVLGSWRETKMRTHAPSHRMTSLMLWILPQGQR
jgi:hypothetical protein